MFGKIHYFKVFFFPIDFVSINFIISTNVEILIYNETIISE